MKEDIVFLVDLVFSVNSLENNWAKVAANCQEIRLTLILPACSIFHYYHKSNRTGTFWSD